MDTKEHLWQLSLEQKIAKSKDVIREALSRFNSDRLVVAWTGGKDSTLVLWVVREVCQEQQRPVPSLMFINEGYVFEEVIEFKTRMEREWSLRIQEVQNDDVLRLAKKPGDRVQVADLNRRNQEELKKLDFHDTSFIWEPESFVGNHLMKTVAMNLFIEQNRIEGVFVGVRWDEQSARANEAYLSPRTGPDHTRIHPILHFKERDVWDATNRYHLPVNPLYAQGFRSLGTKDTTTKTSSLPAWEQDLENTPEREGRRQDKEGIMEKLRGLGYM
jgi:phosphoadenosine phosphosulfate reductase